MYPRPYEQWQSPIVKLLYRISIPVALLIWLLPLFVVFVTSMRSGDELNMGNYWGIPTEFSMVENYTQALTNSPMLGYFINSLLVSCGAAIGSIGLAALAGYGLSTYQFRGNTLLFAIFIAGNFIPYQILMIPVRSLTDSMGLIDTRLGLTLFHIAFQTGFCTLFLRNFIKQLPYDLIEAARLDGANEWDIFARVILPLIRPALAALAVLIFTFIWNDYFWALTLTQSDAAFPVTVGVAGLRGQWSAAWNLISAGSILASLPPVALFFMMQKHFIAGLTLGATKG
ncbi:MAG: carbohydrate ABC transporter permease [Formosimonas sp.]